MSSFVHLLYYMSKKFLLILYSKLLCKMGQDFFDIRYEILFLTVLIKFFLCVCLSLPNSSITSLLWKFVLVSSLYISSMLIAYYKFIFERFKSVPSYSIYIFLLSLYVSFRVCLFTWYWERSAYPSVFPLLSTRFILLLKYSYINYIYIYNIYIYTGWSKKK